MKKILVFMALYLISVSASSYADILSLKECLKSAAENNSSLKVIGFNEKIAADDIEIAKSANMPRVDAHGAFTAQNVAQSIKVGPSALDMQDSNYPSANLSITQTIYDFGRTSSRIQRAEDLKAASEQSYKSREQDVFIKVVESYYGILEAEKLLKAADDEIVQMEHHLKMANALYGQGSATRNDVLQAEVQLANSRQRRLTVANRLENRWLTMDFLIGRNDKRISELEEEPMTQSTPFTDPDKTDFSKHPEIKTMQKLIDAGNSALKESKSQYLPEVFGRIQADYLKNSQVEEESILSATIGMKVNLFDGYATTSRCSQSFKNLLRSQEALREAMKRLKLEYQTAVNDSMVAEKRIGAISKAISQGEENLRINKNKYEEHVGTATNVLDAQFLLTQTRTEFYRAIFDKEVALARIRKATGDL